VSILGIDLENPSNGAEAYVEVGYGWAGATGGGVYGFNMVGCTLFPSKSLSAIKGVKLKNTTGAYLDNNEIGLSSPGSPSSLIWLEGTTNVNTRVGLTNAGNGAAGVTVDGISLGPSFGVTTPWALNGPSVSLSQALPPGVQAPSILGPQGLVGNWYTSNSSHQSVLYFGSSSSHVIPDGTELTIFGNDGGNTTIVTSVGGTNSIVTASGQNIVVTNGMCLRFVRQTVGSAHLWYEVVQPPPGWTALTNSNSGATLTNAQVALLADTTAGTITVITPTMPKDNQPLSLKDSTGRFDTHSFTLTANPEQKLEYPKGTFTAVAGSVTFSASYTAATWSYSTHTAIWYLMSTE
jgi:hypothetical protein